MWWWKSPVCRRRMTSGHETSGSLDSQIRSQTKSNASLQTCVQFNALSGACVGKQLHGAESVTTEVLSPESGVSQTLELQWNISLSLSLSLLYYIYFYKDVWTPAITISLILPPAVQGTRHTKHLISTEVRGKVQRGFRVTAWPVSDGVLEHTHDSYSPPSSAERASLSHYQRHSQRRVGG